MCLVCGYTFYVCIWYVYICFLSAAHLLLQFPDNIFREMWCIECNVSVYILSVLFYSFHLILKWKISNGVRYVAYIFFTSIQCHWSTSIGWRFFLFNLRKMNSDQIIHILIHDFPLTSKDIYGVQYLCGRTILLVCFVDLLLFSAQHVKVAMLLIRYNSKAERNSHLSACSKYVLC